MGGLVESDGMIESLGVTETSGMAEFVGGGVCQVVESNQVRDGAGGRRLPAPAVWSRHWPRVDVDASPHLSLLTRRLDAVQRRRDSESSLARPSGAGPEQTARALRRFF